MIKPNFYIPGVFPKGWGDETWFANNDEYCGKLLRFNKGAKFSFHSHILKRESFYVLTGAIKFNYFDLSNANRLFKNLYAGDCVEIPRNCPHQIEALENSVIIEVSTHHEDSDSYRIEKGDSQKTILVNYH